MEDDYCEHLMKNYGSDTTNKSVKSADSSKADSHAPPTSVDQAQAELSQMLANIREKSKKTEETLLQPPTTQASPSASFDEADDRQLMKELIAQVKSLTLEVKNVREQLELREKPDDSCLQDKPPGNEAEMLESLDLILEESNNTEKSQAAKKKKNKAVSIVSNIIFYILVIAIVFGAFLLRSGKNGKPFMVGGYSAMTVLTGSMEDVYPKGSLIITKATDANKLKIGDDITFMTGETSSITHRIIGITENYAETGKRGFETKGVMNANPDKDIVAASNVVGRVVFCSKALGDIASYITANWPFLLFVVAVLIILLAFLQWNSKRSSECKNEASKSASEKEHTKRKHRKRRI